MPTNYNGALVQLLETATLVTLPDSQTAMKEDFLEHVLSGFLLLDKLSIGIPTIKISDRKS